MNATYSVYGFRIRIEERDSLQDYFDLHYGIFKTETDAGSPPDLLISPWSGPSPLPIRRLGAVQGLNIEKQDGSTVIYYEDGVDNKYIMSHTDLLMWWHDKVKVHSGGIEHAGQAYLFFAAADTGKTGTTLHLLKKGYDFLSDDWVVVDERANAYLYPKPIRVYDYNLARDKNWCKKLFPMTWPIRYPYMKARLGFKNYLAPRLPTRVLRYAAKTALAYPIRIAPPPIDFNRDDLQDPRPINTIFWLEKDDNQADIVIQPIDIDTLLDKVTHVYFYEWSNYLKNYHSIAVYNGGLEHIDNIGPHYREVLRKTFSNTNLRIVSFPKSRRGVSLFEAVGDYIKDRIDPAG